MKKFLTIKNLIFATILMIVVSLVVYLYRGKNQPLPEIILSTPQNNSVGNSVTSPLSLKFNLPIIVGDIRVNSNPNEDWELTQVDKQTISLNHKKYLQSNTKYFLSFSYKGSPLTSIVFSTAGGQNSPRYFQELESELDRDYPLAIKTPYETSSFRVVYSLPLTLEITLKNSDLSEDEVIAEVKSWVTKNGGDATAHKYIFAP